MSGTQIYISVPNWKILSNFQVFCDISRKPSKSWGPFCPIRSDSSWYHLCWSNDLEGWGQDQQQIYPSQDGILQVPQSLHHWWSQHQDSSSTAWVHGSRWHVHVPLLYNTIMCLATICSKDISAVLQDNLNLDAKMVRVRVGEKLREYY